MVAETVQGVGEENRRWKSKSRWRQRSDEPTTQEHGQALLIQHLIGGDLVNSLHFGTAYGAIEPAHCGMEIAGKFPLGWKS